MIERRRISDDQFEMSIGFSSPLKIDMKLVKEFKEKGEGFKSVDDHLKIAADTGDSNKCGSALIYAFTLQTPLYGLNDILNKYRLTPLRESKTDDIRRYIKDPTRGDAGCFAVPKQVFSAFDGNVKKSLISVIFLTKWKFF